MEREAAKAAPAGREENNHLNDCWTLRIGRERGSSYKRGEEAINDFHQ